MTEVRGFAPEADVDAPEPPVSTSSPNTRRRMNHLRDLLAGAVTVVSTYAVVSLAYGWTRLFSAAPIDQEGDGGFYVALARTIGQTGWWTSTDRLGFPHRQVNYDFPLGGDTQSIATLRLLRTLTSEPGRMINLFYLLTFVMAALTAFLVLRQFGCRRLISIPLAVAFATAPYHFWRGEANIFLSSYWVVPIAVLVIVRADRVESWLRDGWSQSGPRRLTRPTILLFAAGALALNGFYYAFFFLLVLAVVTAARALLRRNARELLGPGLVAALAMAALGLAMLPSQLYSIRNGPNNAPVVRTYVEQEIYGLRFVELVMPSHTSRVGALARLGAKANEGLGGERGSSHLGVLATAGLVVLLATSFVTLVGSDRRRTAKPTDATVLAAIVVACMLFAAPGGFGAVLSLAGLKVIRAWNRMSIFIAFASLVGLGLRAEKAIQSYRVRHRISRGTARLVGYLMVAVALVGVFADQVPDERSAAKESAFEYRVVDGFVADVERAFGHDATVFTWPMLRYPTPQTQAAPPYGNLLLYAYSEGLRLSAGAMMGRPDEWTLPLTDQPIDRVVRSAALAGFDAFYVDLWAAGSATAQEEVQTAVEALTGPPVAKDALARRLVFDLRGLRSRQDADPARQAASVRVVAPVRTTFGGDVFEGSVSTDGFTKLLGSHSSITFEDNRPTSRDVRLVMNLTAPAGQGSVTVTGAGEQTIAVGPEPAPVEVRVHLEPGQHTTIRFDTNAPSVSVPGDPRDVRLQVSNGLVTDDLVEQLIYGV